MIQPRAVASVTDRATLTRVDSPLLTSQARQAVTLTQIRRTPLVSARRESLQRIDPLPVIICAEAATAAPVVTRPEINQFGPARQFGIITTSRSMKTTATAVLRQYREPFHYIRVVPPAPPTPQNIDGGLFGTDYTNSLDGGQFGETNPGSVDGGGFF